MSKKLYEILKAVNGSQSKYRKFIVEDVQVGLIRPEVTRALSNYPDVFVITPDRVSLNSNLANYEDRSVAIEAVLRRLKEQNQFTTLKGWRDEYYEVKTTFDASPLLKIDRSSTCLFGIKNYGISLTGYVNHPDMGLCLWLQKRSKNKQRWPGLWDNMVGGGISTGQSVLQTLYKECVEEASIPLDYHKDIISVGTVGCFFESDEGIFPNTVFVFDLPIPPQFKPENSDGEVETFALVPVKKCLEIIEEGMFKQPIILVVVDFFIRHGVIPADDPYYVGIVEMLHVELQKLYGH